MHDKISIQVLLYNNSVDMKKTQGYHVRSFLISAMVKERMVTVWLGLKNKNGRSFGRIKKCCFTGQRKDGGFSQISM